MINSFLNYTGNKYKLLPQILPHFDYSKNTFIDLFAGGGAVFANVLDKYQKIIVNDKIYNLIKIHELIFDEQFIKFVKNACPDKDDKEGFLELRKFYNENPSPDRLMALILCCTNNFARFNLKGEFNQTHGKRTFNKKTAEKIELWVKHVKPFLDKISFYSLDFGAFLVQKQDKNMFFYIDPPYTATKAGYNTVYKKEDDLGLFNLLKAINSAGNTFCLSNVLCEKDFSCNAPIVNLCLEYGFNLVKLNYNYLKVARNKNKEQFTEILIKNY